MRCLIVDDEPLAHEVILTYLADIPFLENGGQCYRATEALPVLNNESIDLIFLDIRMPKLNGLDFIRTLQQRPLIIVMDLLGFKEATWGNDSFTHFSRDNNGIYLCQGA